MTRHDTNQKNKLVYLKTLADDGKMYECIGVMMEDSLEYTRVAFNAHNDVVKDDIVVQKNNILELKVLEEVEEYIHLT